MDAAPHWTLLSFEGNKAGRNYCIEFLRDVQRQMRQQRIDCSGRIPNRVWEETWRQWQQHIPALRYY
jgi:hypothetical protein